MNDMVNLPVARLLPTRAYSVFDDGDSFEFGQRMAKALASSNLLPPTFQNNLPNCLILIDIARPMKVSLFTIASHLNIIHGRPTWSAQFVIATINASGMFSGPLRYEWGGEENTDDWRCRGVATDAGTSEVVKGSWVSIKMAKDEGWYNRPGSKWKNMPQQMLMYRAASFFGKLYCGHLLSGMPTSDEVYDDRRDTPRTTPGEPREVEGVVVNTPADSVAPLAAVNAQVRATRRNRRTQAAAVIDNATGADAPEPPVSAPAAAAGITPAAPASASPAPAGDAAEASGWPTQERPADTPGDNDIF